MKIKNIWNHHLVLVSGRVSTCLSVLERHDKKFTSKHRWFASTKEQILEPVVWISEAFRGLFVWQQTKQCRPPKINMEPKNEGLVQMIFLSNMWFSGFHVYFPGCTAIIKANFTNSPYSCSFFFAVIYHAHRTHVWYICLHLPVPWILWVRKVPQKSPYVHLLLVSSP